MIIVFCFSFDFYKFRILNKKSLFSFFCVFLQYIYYYLINKNKIIFILLNEFIFLVISIKTCFKQAFNFLFFIFAFSTCKFMNAKIKIKDQNHTK